MAANAKSQDDGSASKYNLPTPTKAGAIRPPSTSEKANGQPLDDEAARWAKVGWAPRFGLPGSMDDDEGTTLLDHQTWLEGKLEDKFFGGA